jgi:hypothetical protein
MGDPQAVRVAVIYEAAANRPKPVWFDLRGNQVRITEICYFWRSFSGDTEYLNFSVMTVKGAFDLAFNTKGQSWQVVEKTEGE